MTLQAADFSCDPDWISPEREKDYSPEYELACAVIEQAVKDLSATRPVRRQTEEKRRYKQRVLRWHWNGGVGRFPGKRVRREPLDEYQLRLKEWQRMHGEVRRWWRGDPGSSRDIWCHMVGLDPEVIVERLSKRGLLG